MPQTQPTQAIDPQAKALVSAIGEAETGHSSPSAYQKSGASGEYGRYQFMPDTWSAYAKEAGVSSPLQQASIEDQNKVAYHKIKQWKDQGYNPAQIASMWNAGPGRPNAYKENFKGTNDKGVAYDTPAYAAKVSQYYQQNKANMGGGVMADTNQPTPTNPSLMEDLSKTAEGVGTGVSNALNDTLTNQINPLSGLIQGAGAIAGGVGTAFNNVLEHTPVIGDAYKGLESGIGNVVGAAANTDTGKGLISDYQQFSQAHPELAGDIGAGVNIASILPIGKGLSLLKGGLTDAAETAVKGSATKAAENEIRSTITSKATKGLAKAEARGVNPIKTLTENKAYLPDVVRSGDKFVYDASKASGALNASLDADEETLQSRLSQLAKGKKGQLVDLNQVRAKVLKDIQKEYSMTGSYRPALKAANEYFDSFAESTGGRNFIDLNELNAMKRDVRKAVFNIGGDVRGTAAADVKYNIGQSLMKQVEEMAKKAGIMDVGALNKGMSNKIEALKVLEGLNGKAIKGGTGASREIARDVAGGVGETVGNAMGVPLAGTFAGRGLAGLVGRRLPKTAIGKLKSGRPLSSTIRKGTAKVAKGLAGQAVARQLQSQK